MGISLIGEPLYKAFIHGYTTKQWGRDPKTLPAHIIQRLPFRKNYDESYYNSFWQGGTRHPSFYNFDKNIKVMLNTDFFDVKKEIPQNAKIIYSGPIDKLFNYKYGPLEWRSLKFEFERKRIDDFQGTSVMNYAEEKVPFTRIHEWKHLHPEREVFNENITLLTKEFSINGDPENPFYPIGGEKNRNILAKYMEEAKKLDNFIIGGRLGEYKYYDMHQTIAKGLEIFGNIKNEK